MSKTQTHMHGRENAAGFNDYPAPLKDAYSSSVSHWLCIKQLTSLKMCNQNLSMARDGWVSAAAWTACLQADAGILAEKSVLCLLYWGQPSHLDHKENEKDAQLPWKQPFRSDPTVAGVVGTVYLSALLLCAQLHLYTISKRHEKACLWVNQSTHILLSTVKTALLRAVTQSRQGTGRG